MNRNLIIMDSSGVLLFDGLQGVAWKILMKHSIAARGVRIVNISPGEIYTFIFLQDGNGFHTFEWPTLVSGGMGINGNPSAVSVQNFIGDNGGRLKAIIPGSW